MQEPDRERSEGQKSQSPSADPRPASLRDSEGNQVENAGRSRYQRYEEEDEVARALHRVWHYFKEKTLDKADAGALLNAMLTFILICIGAVTAFIYILQLREMRRSVDLTRRVVESSQAAAFNCESRIDPIGQQFVMECSNRGQIAATHITGFAEYTRSEDGVVVQHSSHHIDRADVLKDANLDVIFPFERLPSEDYGRWLRYFQTQKATVKITTKFTFYDGVTDSVMYGCWASIYTNNSFQMTDCENAQAINSAKKQ